MLSATRGLPAPTRTESLARLRALRSDLIDPAIAAHHGRIVKRTGDGSIIEFRSVVDAVRCGIEVQTGLIERNAGLPPEKRIEFRVGIHVGDVVEKGDGDLMGVGVNIAARLEGIANPGAICLSEDAYRQVKGRVNSRSAISARKNSRTSPNLSASICFTSAGPLEFEICLDVRVRKIRPAAPLGCGPAFRQHRRRPGARVFRRRGDGEFSRRTSHAYEARS